MTKAQTTSEVWVYVLALRIDGEYGWTSVQSTREGARAHLEEKIDEFYVREYEAQLTTKVSGEMSTEAGDEGDFVAYGSSTSLETP